MRKFIILSLSPIHLPPIMTLDTPYSLSEAVPMPVLVVRMTELVLVVYQTRIDTGYTCTMQAPIMLLSVTLHF